MDKTTRLVRWQRITIVVLLSALMVCIIGFKHRLSQEYDNVMTAVADSEKLIKGYNSLKSTSDQLVIRNLEQKLDKYEPGVSLFVVSDSIDRNTGYLITIEAKLILEHEGILECCPYGLSTGSGGPHFDVRPSDFAVAKSLLLQSKRFEKYRNLVEFCSISAFTDS